MAGPGSSLLLETVKWMPIRKRSQTCLWFTNYHPKFAGPCSRIAEKSRRAEREPLAALEFGKHPATSGLRTESHVTVGRRVLLSSAERGHDLSVGGLRERLECFGASLPSFPSCRVNRAAMASSGASYTATKSLFAHCQEDDLNSPPMSFSRRLAVSRRRVSPGCFWFPQQLDLQA